MELVNLVQTTPNLKITVLYVRLISAKTMSISHNGDTVSHAQLLGLLIQQELAVLKHHWLPKHNQRILKLSHRQLVEKENSHRMVLIASNVLIILEVQKITPCANLICVISIRSLKLMENVKNALLEKLQI